MAAFGVDYVVILLYLGLLTLVGVFGRGVGVVPDDITTPAGRVLAQLAVFVVLTVPVSGWFAGWEAGPRGATPGKLLLGLRVLTTDGDRVLLGVANAAIVVDVAMLFVGSRRPPHDRVAGTVVAQVAGVRRR